MRFILTADNGTKKAELAGSFNGWQPQAMRKQKNKSFAVTVPLDAGRHEYKFLVDGEWVVDPDNNHWAANPFGTINSIVEIE